MTVEPGWYADPAEPTTQRYWDGEGWVGTPLPADATPPPGPPPADEPEPLPAPTSGAGAARGSPATLAGMPPVGGTPPVSGAPQSGPPYGTPPVSGAPQSGPPYGTPPYGPPPGWPGPYWVAPPPRPHGLELAPLGARVLARLIDIGLVLLLNVLVNGWFVWRFVQEIEPVTREIFRRAMAGDSTTEGLPQASPQADWLQVVILLIAAALWFAYEVPSVANSGQTFGKRVMGIKVVALTETEQPGFGRSFRRWNMLGLPVFLWSCCGIGFLIQLVDCALAFFDRPLRQALHDKRGQTVVVRLPSRAGSPPEPTPTDSSGGPAS
ncbi:RDD family protein [Plantactinospora sp. WMMB334]|uniref:RDD family protein n=1 Tax=Plantactinospora sp. WMMB334 TaxID=3404119 RepID=UPI003B937455